MSDTLSFAELEAQDVQLLPARTVLSLLSLSGVGGGGTHGHNGSSHNGISIGSGSNVNIGPPGSQVNIAGKGIGGQGGSAY
jgi:hypothetical protein